MPMSLHEEYIQRHNLNVPVVLYNHRSTVFLRNKDAPYNWRVLVFSWRDGGNHPSFFEITYSEAVHNGHEQGKLIKDLIPATICYADDYEAAVHRMVANVRNAGYYAFPPEEQILAAWHFFLKICDSWLASTMDQAFFWLVEHTLRSDLPVSARLKACSVAQKQLWFDSRANDLWSYQILPLARYGSEWLVKLINE